MTNAIVQFVQLPIIFTQKQRATAGRFFPLSIRMLLALQTLFQNSDNVPSSEASEWTLHFQKCDCMFVFKSPTARWRSTIGTKKNLYEYLMDL